MVESIGQKNVLILSSYGNEISILDGYESKQWTDEIISAINSKFVDSKENINVKMEYMDLGQSYWTQYYDLYKYNSLNTKFDAVISLDDNAFCFLLKYGENLFENTPIVFSGVNNFNKSMISNNPFFTGLAKSPDIQKTIDVALRIHPNTKQIFVVADTSVGIDYKSIMEALMPSYSDKVKFIFSDEKNIKWGTTN